MTAASAIRAGQRAALAIMTDAVTIARVGEPVTDLDTGEVVSTETEIYSGPGRIQTYEAQEANPNAGGSIWTQQRYAAHVPVGSCDPHVGDVVTVVSASIDPRLAGRRYRVVALLHKTFPTAYRLGVEELLI